MERELKMFKDLNEEEKLSLVGAYLQGKTIEFKPSLSSLSTWGEKSKLGKRGDSLSFAGGLYYRTKVEKPSIDWSAIGYDYNYLAVDANGNTFLYQNRPIAATHGFFWLDKHEEKTVKRLEITKGLISSLSEGNCHWGDSLISRYDDE